MRKASGRVEDHRIPSGISHFLAEALRFFDCFPEVGRTLEADLDAHGLRKMQDRKETAGFPRRQGTENERTALWWRCGCLKATRRTTPGWWTK